MAGKVPQREVRIEIDGTWHVGRYEVRGFTHGGHELVVYYRGKEARDRIVPEVNHESYTDFLAEKLLERLVREVLEA
jgi:hypothetical protein